MKTTSILLFCIVMNLGPPSFGGDFIQIIPDGFEENSDVSHHGYYLNQNHCFSVVIPRNVVGKTSSQPSSQHGFGAVLSKGTDAAYLDVEGDPGSWLDDPDVNGPRTIEKAAIVKMKHLLMDNVIILRQTYERTTLGELPAGRNIIYYTLQGSQNEIIYDSMFTLDSGGTYYEITLYATKSGYVRNKDILDKIAKTWKLTDWNKCRKNFINDTK